MTNYHTNDTARQLFQRGQRTAAAASAPEYGNKLQHIRDEMLRPAPAKCPTCGHCGAA